MVEIMPISTLIKHRLEINAGMTFNVMETESVIQLVNHAKEQLDE